ncbi:hypothetical protein CLU79DRAFT_760363, partial [Phycomyces nitens]
MVFCIYFCLALSESLLYSIVAYTNILIHYFLLFLLLFCQFVYFLNNTFFIFLSLAFDESIASTRLVL